MLATSTSHNNLASGVSHYIDGVRLLWHPKLRIYILVPLLVNIVLFFILTSTLIAYITSFNAALSSSLPSWLEWAREWLAPLAWIAWILMGIIILIIYGYSFNMITNILAAPFYGLLATKTEELLTGQRPPDESLSDMIPRVFLREISKLIYFLTRGFVILLLMIFIGTIPLVNILAPAIGVAWGAWSMAVQYADYPADNHQLSFKNLRQRLWDKKFSSAGFGGCVMICSIIPVVNIFAMPAAVTGGTYLWLKELRDQQA